MASRTLAILAAEIQRRVTNISQTDAVAALNRAYAFIHDMGSFTFDFTGVSSGSSIASIVDLPSGEYTLPGDCDIRKAMFIANSPSGLPILKSGGTHLWESFGLNIVPEVYSTYTLSGRKLLLRPGSGGDIGVRYHVVFTYLDKSVVSRMPTERLDDLAVDYAVGMEKEIYDVGENWMQLQKDAISALTAELQGYHTISEQPMPETEAQEVIQEQTQVGRAS
jgi:hypothetical protein